MLTFKSTAKKLNVISKVEQALESLGDTVVYVGVVGKDLPRRNSKLTNDQLLKWHEEGTSKMVARPSMQVGLDLFKDYITEQYLQILNYISLKENEPPNAQLQFLGVSVAQMIKDAMLDDRLQSKLAPLNTQYLHHKQVNPKLDDRKLIATRQLRSSISGGYFVK